MADKGKRIASRQAQLNRRKRRGKGRTQQFDAGPGESAESPSSDAPQASVAPAAGQATPETPETTGAPEATPEPTSAPARAASSTRASRRGRAAARAEAAAVYPYLGVELRHIGVITAVLAVALVVLTLLLR
jgi:hypothetical protein